MRPVLTAYLTLYFLIVAGAGLTVWRSGLIEHLHLGWTMTVLAAALALGVFLGIVSRR